MSVRGISVALRIPVLTIAAALSLQAAGAAAEIMDRSTPVRLLQGINERMQTCWVKSKDSAFRAYKVIPELDTRHGKPRILIVRAKASQGLPQLVIEASGKPARLSSYGPLASDPLAVRMDADVRRWLAGDSGCKD